MNPWKRSFVWTVYPHSTTPKRAIRFFKTKESADKYISGKLKGIDRFRIEREWLVENIQSGAIRTYGKHVNTYLPGPMERE